MIKKSFFILSTAIIFFSLIFLVKSAFASFDAASDNLKVATVAGIVSIISFFLARYFEQKRELRQKIYAEKIVVYTNLIDILFSFFGKGKKPIPTIEREDLPDSEDEMALKLRNAQKELIFWGSDSVIKSWMDFMREAQTKDEMTTDKLALLLTKFGHLIVSMRRDVGYRFTTIGEQHIAQIILTSGVDEDEIISKVLRNSMK